MKGAPAICNDYYLMNQIKNGAAHAAKLDRLGHVEGLLHARTRPADLVTADRPPASRRAGPARSRPHPNTQTTMSSYILFLILGLGSGATYAILGQGLVLKYRSAGVVDFAHGAVAMFIAYVFVNLRSYGELELPVVVIPHQISPQRRGGDQHDAGDRDLARLRRGPRAWSSTVLVYRPLRMPRRSRASARRSA